MAHSHDKTLLARLGFQDPDAKDPLHDLACEYMALEENVLKLQSICQPLPELSKEVTEPFYKEPNQQHLIDGRFVYSVSETKIKVTSATELALSKGDNQYRVTVGFLDVNSSWIRERHRVGSFSEREWSGSSWVYKNPIQVDDWSSWIVPAGTQRLREERGRIVTEVKIHPVGTGDLLRQLNLYRAHVNDDSIAWVVAVAFDVNEYYRSALEREGITLVRLGERFGKWAVEKNDAKHVKLPEF